MEDIFTAPESIGNVRVRERAYKIPGGLPIGSRLSALKSLADRLDEFLSHRLWPLLAFA
jgi:hypothetical protein